MDKHEGMGMLGAIAQVTILAPLPDEDPGQINKSDGLLEGCCCCCCCCRCCYGGQRSVILTFGIPRRGLWAGGHGEVGPASPSMDKRGRHTQSGKQLVLIAVQVFSSTVSRPHKSGISGVGRSGARGCCPLSSGGFSNRGNKMCRSSTGFLTSRYQGFTNAVWTSREAQ